MHGPTIWSQTRCATFNRGLSRTAGCLAPYTRRRREMPGAARRVQASAPVRAVAGRPQRESIKVWFSSYIQRRFRLERIRKRQGGDSKKVSFHARLAFQSATGRRPRICRLSVGHLGGNVAGVDGGRRELASRQSHQPSHAPPRHGMFACCVACNRCLSRSYGLLLSCTWTVDFSKSQSCSQTCRCLRTLQLRCCLR